MLTASFKSTGLAKLVILKSSIDKLLTGGFKSLMVTLSTYYLLTASFKSTGLARLVILKSSIDKLLVGGFRSLIGVTSVESG